MESWRFLDTGYQNGATNMAIDRVLATISVPQDKVPVFRVYRWQPYTISLGYNQNENELDLEKCNSHGIGVVKRPTGGRAVFHAQEITYSVVLPRESDFYSPDILTTYNLINKGLLSGLQLLGVDAELVERDKGHEKSASYKENIPCFSNSAQYEITCNNKKLVGSAQRRYEDTILQHGSILTGPDHLRLADYVNLPDKKAVERFRQSLKDKTISIAEILSCNIKDDDIVQKLFVGFQNTFNIQFTKSQLTPQEKYEVEKMLKHIPKAGGTHYEN